MAHPVASTIYDEIIEKHSLDCYIIFNSDRHLNEYIREEDMKVKEVSGFTGSNGTVVLSKDPCLITDSRYFLQAENESKFPLVKEKLSEYILSKNYKRVSFDTRTISSKAFANLVKDTGIKFIDTDKDLPRTKINMEPIIDLEELSLLQFMNVDPYARAATEYLTSMGFDMSQASEILNGNLTGSVYTAKISRIRGMIGEKLLIFTEMDTICWILNLRGSDIDYNPLFFAYLILDSEKCVLFTDHTIKNREIVDVRSYSEFEDYIVNDIKDRSILISGDCNQYIFSRLSRSGSPSLCKDIRDMQASKNETELCGMALAYFFDGIALTELFAFIKSNKGLTEEDIDRELLRIKKELPGFVQPSFETISSTGPNAAIVHHRASDATVSKDEIYLIDSGSHYYFGTTDTTRTLYFGKTVPDQIKHDYTLVLRGHLNAMMDECTTYCKIDERAREFLKAEEKDFGHAVGHGVGHFLCVHEHPPVVSPPSPRFPSLAVEPNQVFSIEPGFYKDGEYGIRIESLVMSRMISGKIRLINLTLVPYQNRLVDFEQMTESEKDYYNEMNEKCVNALKSVLSYDGYEFLRQECNAN